MWFIVKICFIKKKCCPYTLKYYTTFFITNCSNILRSFGYPALVLLLFLLLLIVYQVRHKKRNQILMAEKIQDSSNEMGCYLEEKSKMYHSWVGQSQEKAVFQNASHLFLHWLLNRFHSQKRFCSTFPCHTSRNHKLFGLFVCVMKKPIPWNFIFFIHTIDTIVLSIEGNIHRKILFVLPYASFDWSFFRKFFRQGSGSFCSPLLCSRTHPWCFYSFKLL